MFEEDFGEGLFDKGVFILILLGWGMGDLLLCCVGGDIWLLLCDGGLCLCVDGWFYDKVCDSQLGQFY